MTSCLSSVGCVVKKTDTSWVKPIYFRDETINWLNSLDWPSTAFEDFDQIRKHNEKCERIQNK